MRQRGLSAQMSLRASKFAERHRDRSEAVMRQYGSFGNEQNGVFFFPQKGLLVIVSSGEGWEHASVSRRNRIPSYEDMCFVASQFWDDDDTLMQLRVPSREHINVSENCLHWWRPIDEEIPRPPGWMVG